MSWEKDFEKEKSDRGMATPGTVRYIRNAAHILSHCPDRPDTRSKMEDLAQSSDPETKEVANKWLSDQDDTSDGSDYEADDSDCESDDSDSD